MPKLYNKSSKFDNILLPKKCNDIILQPINCDYYKYPIRIIHINYLPFYILILGADWQNVYDCDYLPANVWGIGVGWAYARLHKVNHIFYVEWRSLSFSESKRYIAYNVCQHNRDEFTAITWQRHYMPPVAHYRR